MTPLNRRLLEAASTSALTVTLTNAGRPIPEYQLPVKATLTGEKLAYEPVLFRFVGPASVDGYQVICDGQIEMAKAFESPFLARAGDEIELSLAAGIY